MSTAFSASLTSDVSTGATFTLVFRIAHAALSAAGQPQCRVTLTPPSAGSLHLANVFIGTAHATNLYDFTGDQVRVTFGGANDVTLTSGGGNHVSDWVNYSILGSADINIAVDNGAYGAGTARRLASDASVGYYYASVVDAATAAKHLDATFTYAGTLVDDVSLIEVLASVPRSFAALIG